MKIKLTLKYKKHAVYKNASSSGRIIIGDLAV